jgi:hypothetical protein
MYLSDSSKIHYKKRTKFINIYHDQGFGFSAEWHFFATRYGKGQADETGGTVKDWL